MLFCNLGIRFLKLLSHLKYSRHTSKIVNMLFFILHSLILRHQFYYCHHLFLFNQSSFLAFFPYCTSSHFEIELKIWKGCLLSYAWLSDLKSTVSFQFFFIVRRIRTEKFSAGRGIRTLETFRSQAFLIIPGLRPTRLGDPGSTSFKLH